LIDELRRSAWLERAAPDAAAPYLDKVRRRAYTVTDRDVTELHEAGLSDDEIFELTVGAAVGVGLERLRAGLETLG
jgi:alkylhydroperoxidase family enzyme